MSKKKQPTNSTVIATSVLQPQQVELILDKRSSQTPPVGSGKQSISPDLIARLTDRIKKM